MKQIRRKLFTECLGYDWRDDPVGAGFDMWDWSHGESPFIYDHNGD